MSNLPDQARAVAYMYDSWAHRYDEDVLERYKYDAPSKVVETITQLSGIKPVRILDLATGTGIVLEKLKESFNGVTTIGLDVSNRMLEKCRSKGITRNLHACDIESEQWPVEDKSIDIISCAGALSMIGSLDHIFAETARTLKQGGIAVMSYQISTMNKGALGNEPGYEPVKIYRRHEYEMRQAVEKAGFTVLQSPEAFVGFQTTHLMERHGVIAFTPA